MSGGRWVALALIVVLSGLFAYFNAGQRVTLHLGFTTLYRLSLAHIVLSAFLLGMVTMFLVGLRNDLRVRRDQRSRPPARSFHSEPTAREVDRFA